MSDDLKRFRATVRHEGENIFDPPWLEEFWAVRHEDAADRIEELEAKLAKAVEALSSTRRADDLREAYHRLPNDKNRIGDKKSKKSRARDAWLRAFRKAAKEASAVLAEINGGDDE